VLSARAEGRSPFPSGSAAAEGKKEKPKRPPTAYNTYIKTVQEQVKAQVRGLLCCGSGGGGGSLHRAHVLAAAVAHLRPIGTHVS
jgi:hypothetical protein